MRILAIVVALAACTHAPRAVMPPPAAPPAPSHSVGSPDTPHRAPTTAAAAASFDTVTHLFFGPYGHADSSRLALRDSTEFTRVWSFHAERYTPRLRYPSIDFHRQSVLVVSTNLRGGNGDMIRIDSLVPRGDTLLVHVVTIIMVGPMTGSAVTRPVDFVMVPWTGPVRFIEHRRDVQSYTSQYLVSPKHRDLSLEWFQPPRR